MKNLFRLFFLFALLLSFLTIQYSCSKKKGCTDKESLNYDNSAEENDGSCKYPADKLAGPLWSVSEYQTSSQGNSTDNYTVTITKTDNNNIMIHSYRDHTPKYYQNDKIHTIDWQAKTLSGAKSSTIVSENCFILRYPWGDVSTSTIYDIEETYTR